MINFNFIPIEPEIGAAMPINTDLNELRNKYDYDIILNGKHRGSFSLIEISDPTNEYVISINFDATSEIVIQSLIDEIKFQCVLGNIYGTDEDYFTILFSSDYNTTKLTNLCNYTPGDVFYIKLPNDRR